MVILATIASACFILAASPKPDQPKEPPSQPSLGAIVRLHIAEDGRFFCSGTVISDHLILTANHCIQEAPEGYSISVRGSDRKNVGVYAKVKSRHPMPDYALLSGNFKRFQHATIQTNAATINEVFLNKQSKLVTCGFPYGGDLQCDVITDVHRYVFYFSAQAYLYPGMSGGPVFDLDTNTIIAINQAVSEREAIFSPLVSLWDCLRVAPPKK